MKKVLGAAFLVAGVVFTYLFAAGGTFCAREFYGRAFDNGLPFQALGRNYPADALYLAAALLCLLIGLYCVLTDFPAPAGQPRGGKVARILFLNALLLLAVLGVGLVGAKANQDPLLVAAFGVTALLQILLGLILLIMSLTEKPKSVFFLVLGTAAYLSGAAIGILVFLWGA